MSIAEKESTGGEVAVTAATTLDMISNTHLMARSMECTAPNSGEFSQKHYLKSAGSKFRTLMLRSGNFGSALIKKFRQQKLQGGYWNIAWCIKPRSDRSCQARQKCIILLVRHQTYLTSAILISMTWVGTIQGSIPNSIIN